MIFSESFGKKYSSNLSFRKKCPGKSVLVLTFYIKDYFARKNDYFARKNDYFARKKKLFC